MRESRALDGLILADFLLGLVSLAWSAGHPAPHPSPLSSALWIAVCAATILAWVGLLYRIEAARALYAASWLGYLAWIAVRGAAIGSPLGSVLDLATGLVGGMILAILFLPVSGKTLRGIGSVSSQTPSAR
jgi:hypothetical protein